MKDSKFINILTGIIAVLPAIAMLFVYDMLPEQVAINYSFSGEVNSYGHKSEMWVFPVINIVIMAMMIFMPKIDPKKDNYKKFGKFYSSMKLVTVIFFDAIFAMMIMGALNPDSVKINVFIPVGVGVLFIFLGNHMPQAKQNFFIGIRTPWTLSSETVWIKTHRIGGFCFIIGGIIISVCSFLPEAIGITAFVATVIICSFIPMVMSYVYYKKENEN